MLLLIFVIIGVLFALPSVFDHRDNGDMLLFNISCFNPHGFYNDALQCQNFSASNPNIGLIMDHTTALNVFALVYIEYNIYENKIDDFDINQTISFSIDEIGRSHTVNDTFVEDTFSLLS